MPKALDITNKRFGKLIAIQKAQSRNGKTYWLCKCDCGNEKEIQTSHLVNGSIQSCGNCGYVNPNNAIKKCEICGSEFEIRSNGASRKYCFDCSPSYPKGGSKTNTTKALRKAMKKEAVKRSGGKCHICGYNKSLRALEFHHKNAEDKEFGLSANGNVHSWDEFWKEA